MTTPRWLTTLVGTAVAVGAAHAQPERPSGANRVVRVFDFEEASDNPLPVPFGWVRAQHDPAVPREREGFPIWNGGVLDYQSPAVSGVGTLRLPAHGGSASLRLLSGVIGVFPGADYAVTARVRTERMDHARAGVVARLLDQDGRPLPATESVSELVRTGGQWGTVSVSVPGIDERAAYLQIELLALQPRQREGGRRAHPFRVWNEDYHAAAWFDDVAVTLLPRMELDTGTPGHVFAADQTPELSVLIRDLSGERLAARVLVLDADGAVADELTMRPGQGRMVERFVPGLPGPGWYTGVLVVEAGGRTVGVERLDFAWGAPEDEGAPRSERFALRAEAWRPEAAAALPTVAAWSGVGHAVVGAWDETMDRAASGVDANPAFVAARRLLDAGLTVTLSLDEAPGDLAELVGMDPWDAPSILAADEDLWMPWAGGALDQFGQGVLSWQIGDRPVHTDAARLGAALDAVGDAVAKWVPGPEIRAAWPVGFALPGALVTDARGLVLRDDGAGADDTLERLVESWAGAAGPASTDGPTLTIEFRAGEDGRVSRAGLGRVARRALTAWAAAKRTGVGDRVLLTLAEPWRSTGGLRPAMMPAPELAVWRTLASVLADDATQSVRDLDLLPGVRTILAGSGDEGVLIAWLEDPEAPLRALDLPLHTGPVRRVDLLGRRTDLHPVRDDGMGLSWHRVELSREPVIVEGVRAELVRFLAGVRLNPERLDPVLGDRRHALVIENPWDFPIRGRVFVVEPGGMSGGSQARDRSWRITPRVVAFSLDAGQRYEEPIELAFGASEEAGWVRSVFDVQLVADEEYPLLRIPRRVEIASDDLDLEVVAYRAGGSVSVHAVVTNRSASARSVEMAVVAAGASRERATVNGLNRGQTAERRFLMNGVAPGARISVGLTEPTTGTRLTRTIEAP